MSDSKDAARIILDFFDWVCSTEFDRACQIAEVDPDEVRQDFFSDIRGCLP